jgi:hypothetical protein
MDVRDKNCRDGYTRDCLAANTRVANHPRLFGVHRFRNAISRKLFVAEQMLRRMPEETVEGRKRYYIIDKLLQLTASQLNRVVNVQRKPGKEKKKNLLI